MTGACARCTVVENESYTYDLWGSRATRDDALHGETETYSYDAEERVTEASATLSGGGSATTLATTYDASGNLLAKSDVGGTIGYTYQSGHPNRLSSVSASGANPGVVSGAIGYDAAGRIESGAGYTVSYDRRGLVSTLSWSATGATLSLAYAPDGQRYRSQIQDASGTTSVWYVAGGAFRIEQKPDGTVSYRQAIVAGGVVIGQLTTRSDGSDAFHYFYRDGLGSTSAITDIAGGSPQGYAYGPYGRRRALGWTSDLGFTATPHIDPPTRRGYTGGEQFDGLGAVVLGARVYLPALGRWLSPDPAGAGSPYVYVGDNPESDVDPTGAFSLGPLSNLFSAIGRGVQELAQGIETYWRPILAIGLAAYTGGLAGAAIYDALATTAVVPVLGEAAVSLPLFASAGAELAVAAGTGAVAGGVFGAGLTALYGGSAGALLSAGLRGAEIGGFAGGAWWAAGEISAAWGFAGQAFAHGVAGGLTGMVAGGSFQKGFELAVLAYSAFTLYQHITGEAPSWKRGNGAVYKERGNVSDESQANNQFGPATTTKDPSLVGTPVANPRAGYEGSDLSNAIDSGPGINAVSNLHDVLGDFYQAANGGTYPLWYLAATIPPATLVTYIGLINTPIGYGIVSSDVWINNHNGP